MTAGGGHGRDRKRNLTDPHGWLAPAVPQLAAGTVKGGTS
jgi:hypothetical protein